MAPHRCPDCGATHDKPSDNDLRISVARASAVGGCNFCNRDRRPERVLVLQGPGPGAALQARMCQHCAAAAADALPGFLR